MQNVKVAGGGNAIVGTIIQHANLVVSDQEPASAARTAPKAAGAGRRHDAADARRDT